ncbi:MAG TPA: hypothetical protein VJS19_00035, partial [Candidatus Dormibacteraeota bacterium]|nr:hypothetical protein [Candidatus Dormibacteraeota bacterium]
MLALVLMLGCACAGGPPVAGPGKGGAASDARLPTLSPSPGAKGGSPSPIAGVVDPSAKCVRQFTGSAMVLIGRALYDVTDPVHPSLVCLISNTSVQLFTADTFEYVRRSGPDGTEVVLHSIGSGNESVVAGWPLKLLDDSGRAMGTWTPDGNSAATILPGTDAAGNQTLQVWLFMQSLKTELYEFPLPLTDCICRFGLPSATIAFSADGQYLVSGWPIGKGAQPLRIYRVADRSLVQTLDLSDINPLWSRMGHKLLIGPQRSWTPEDGLSGAAGGWGYLAGVSPDGTQVAYTAYA